MRQGSGEFPMHPILDDEQDTEAELREKLEAANRRIGELEFEVKLYKPSESAKVGGTV